MYKDPLTYSSLITLFSFLSEQRQRKKNSIKELMMRRRESKNHVQQKGERSHTDV